MDPCSRSQTSLTGSMPVQNLVDHCRATHPPMFGLKYSQLLSLSFDCEFMHSDGNLQTHSLLSSYIEDIVFAACLSFQVTVASLIILQRMYIRLPPAAYKRRAECSARRLFSGAYILAAKQYICSDATLKPTRRFKEMMSNEYWASISSCDEAEVEQLQRDIILVLGGHAVVFRVTGTTREAFDRPNISFPVFRRLTPVDNNTPLLRLSRMTCEEQYLYFLHGGVIPTP